MMKKFIESEIEVITFTDDIFTGSKIQYPLEDVTSTTEKTMPDEDV